MMKYLLVPALSMSFYAPAQVQATPPQNVTSSRNSKNAQLTPAESAEKADPVEEAEIRKLLELTGAKALASDTINSMMVSIRPLMANSLPPGDYREKLVDLFFAKFQSQVDMDQLLNLAVQAYGRYYTRPEIEELVKFYQTPVGQKMAAITPKITSELRDQGQQWGSTLGRQCMTEVLNEHPDLREALEKAVQAKSR